MKTISKEEKELPLMIFYSIFNFLVVIILSNKISNLSNLTLPLMSIAYVINILLLLVFIKNNKVKIIKNNLIYSFLMFLISILSVIINGVNTYDLINALIKTANVFFYFTIFLNVKINKNQLIYLMGLFAKLGIVACLFNFIINYNEILNFYRISSSYELSLCSFFANRNQFGAYIFISIVAYTFYKNKKKSNFKDYCIYIFFIINVLLTMSRGAILACLSFLIYELVRNKKYKTLFNCIFVIMLLVLFISNYFPIFDYIERNLLRLDSGTTGRTVLWKIAYTIWCNSSILFGAGFYNGINIAKSNYFISNSQFHSYFFDVLVDGGICLLFFEIFLMIFSYAKLKKCKEKLFSTIMRGAYYSMILLAFIESIGFFSLGYTDALYTIFFVTIPILLSNYQEN